MNLKKYNTLDDFIVEIDEYVKSFYRPLVPFYRGAPDTTFELLPSIFRNQDNWVEKYSNVSRLENNLFYDFSSYADGLLNVKNEWDILFKMQHHGIPTRLLDWTESLGVAIYFALKYSAEVNKPCIWVLDPYALNNIELNKSNFTDRNFSTLYNPNSDFKRSYYDSFIVNFDNQKDSVFKNPQALYPVKSNDRIRAQWGVFTIHGTDERCLSKQVNKSILKKFVIPNKAIESATKFLNNASINHFSMMPDFDGLQRYLKSFYYKK